MTEPAAPKHCRACGSKLDPPQPACPNCGNVPWAGRAHCPGCAAPTPPGQAACASCGTTLASAPPPPKTAALPGKIQAINIMTLVGGIIGILWSISLGISVLFIFYPPWVYGLVFGIMATIKGAALIGSQGPREKPPKTTAIMGIINIVNCDMPNVVMGILILIFLNDPDVKAYYRSQGVLPPAA